MAKRRSTSDSKTSKGERKSSIRTSGVGVNQAIKMNRKLEALSKGKNVVYTLSNPNKNETNKPFIKVKVNGKNYLKHRAGNA